MTSNFKYIFTSIISFNTCNTHILILSNPTFQRRKLSLREVVELVWIKEHMSGRLGIPPLPAEG